MCKIHLPRCGDRQNRSLNRQNRVKTAAAAALRKSTLLLRARWLAESAVGCLSRMRRRRGRRPTTLPTFTPTKDLIPSLAISDFSHHETNPIQVLCHTGRPRSQARRTPSSPSQTTVERAFDIYQLPRIACFSLYGRIAVLHSLSSVSEVSLPTTRSAAAAVGASIEVEGVNDERARARAA